MNDEKTTHKSTKRMLEFLAWAQVTGIYRTLPTEWSIMHRKARDAGYLERCRAADERRPLGLAAWKISDEGKEALRAGR